MRSADIERRRVQDDEVVGAALAALAAGVLLPGRPSSRRHRWQLLAWDVHPGLAIVAAARRGKRNGLFVGSDWFRLADGEWVWQDRGPSLDFDEARLPARRSLPGETFDTMASHGPADDGVGAGMWTELWFVPGEAAWLRTAERTEPVPAHGFVVRIRTAATDERIEVPDADGDPIGRLGASYPNRDPYRRR